MRFEISLLLLTLLPAQTPPATERPTAETVLARLQQRYSSIKTFTADFTQTFSSQGIRQEESGTLVMKKPGKMRWEYQHPRSKLFLSDGEKAFFYVPEEQQVMVSTIGQDELDTPLLFLFGRGDLGREFAVSYETEEEPSQPGNLLLRLEPLVPRGEFSRVLLELEPEQLRIRRLTVIEPIGSRNDYLLSEVRENVRVPDRTFRFTIPKGTEVIRQ